MEKDQLDSLATVAVGSEKMPPSHSHYAPSEVYSASESPPAYTRPPMKSTAVQIARIIATTMIAISVIIGSFILAAAWLQARASCTPESIAAMQAQMNLQQSQNEFIKHLQPEALVQDRPIAVDNLQSLSDSSSSTPKDEIQADTKDIKIEKNEDSESKVDNENGDDNDSEDDYDDTEFPPVHIKLPLQLDLDDLAGSLLQQARSIVSCVVERRRSDEVMDGANDNNASNSNSTERQRTQRLSGERVAILCESGDPRQEQREQEILTPIIVPLGTVQIPLQAQEDGYNRYQAHNHYQIPDSQRIPIDARGMNSPFPIGMLPPELRNLPHQVSMEMGPPSRPQPSIMRQQPIEMRQIPIEFRHMPIDPIRGIKSQMEQEQFIRDEQSQHPNIPMMFAHADRSPMQLYPQEQQAQGMMPPPPPPPPQQSQQSQSMSHQESQQQQQQIHQQNSRIPSMMIPPRVEMRLTPDPSEIPERSDSPFRGIPMEIRRIIQQVPMEIKNIIERLTDDTTTVPDGARREQVQEFKPFPGGLRPIPVDPFALPIEVRNLLEHGNIEGRPQQNSHDLEEQQQQQQPKSFTGPEDQNEDPEMRNFAVPANVMNIIHQVVERRAFPVPRFVNPMRPIESMEIPVEARAQVSDNEAREEGNHQQQQQEEEEEVQNLNQEQQQQQQQARMMVDHEEIIQNDSNRPHFVQPRSVRSVPEPFAHPREKRVRRCACNCAC